MPESRDVVERCVRLREGEGQGFREDFQRREHFLNGGPQGAKNHAKHVADIISFIPH